MNQFTPIFFSKMKNSFRFILLLAIFALPSISQSADTPFEFANPQQEQRYKELVNELRCLVCQNQSLSDSHAPLAQDLRNEVFRMVGDDTPKKEIIDFLVSRYGDFVLYKPPLKNSTLLLWFGPFLLLLIALATALKLVRNRADNKVEALDAEQAERLKQLMAEPEKNK